MSARVAGLGLPSESAAALVEGIRVMPGSTRTPKLERPDNREVATTVTMSSWFTVV
jgi:hypothetical protein